MTNRIANLVDESDSENPTPEGTNADHEATNQLTADIIKAVTKCCVSQTTEIEGHLNVKTKNPEGRNVLFWSYPTGDFFFWFLENAYTTLVVYKDGKLKELAHVPLTETEKFRELLTTVAAGMKKQ